MNLSQQYVDYFRETRNIYINIALVLGLIIVFIIFPIPLPSTFLFLIKLVILFTLFYLIYKNFQQTIKMDKSKNNETKEKLKKTIILSNIVNLGLLILSVYIWYLIFF